MSPAVDLLLAALIGLHQPVRARSCVMPHGSASTEMFVEQATTRRGDSVVSARLCLAPDAARVGGYSAALRYDSATMRLVNVELAGGIQAKNADTPGIIRL